jgi:hypothetical protein
MYLTFRHCYFKRNSKGRKIRGGNIGCKVQVARYRLQVARLYGSVKV